MTKTEKKGGNALSLSAMGLIFKTTVLKISGSVGWASSRGARGAAGRGAAGRAAGRLTPEAGFPTTLVRSLAPRGAATVRPAQAKVARRESERKNIVGLSECGWKRNVGGVVETDESVREEEGKYDWVDG